VETDILKIQNLQAEAIRLYKLDNEAFQKSQAAAKEHREAFQKSFNTAHEFGHALLSVKAEMKHGQFTPWLLKEFRNQKGGKQIWNRVTYCMRLANGKHDLAQRRNVDWRQYSSKFVKNFRKLYDATRKGNVNKAKIAADQIHKQVEWVLAHVHKNAKARAAKAGA